MKRTLGLQTLFCALVLMGMTGTIFAADSNIDRMVLRIHVEEGDDTKVDISVPLSLVQIVYEAVPKEIKKEIEQTGISPMDVLNELKALEGNDFINISGKDNVRIWIDNERDRNSDALKCIRIEVEENGNDGDNIKINIPVGLVQLASAIVPQLIENGELPAPDTKVIEELEKYLKQLKQE